MANSLYPIWKKALLDDSLGGNANLNETGGEGTFALLIDTGTYTYSDAHDFFNDLSGVVGTANGEEITSPTTTSGVFDGANVTFSTVSGNTVEAIVIFRKNAGANTTWYLVAFIDTGVTGLPVTPNGGDITITWNGSGIFEV